MQTLTRPSKKSETNFRPARPKSRRRFSPLMLIGVLVTVVIALGAGAFLLTRSHTGSHAAAAAVNGDCTLIVPANPLTAQGLATPWQLVATNQNNGPCNQANTAQTTFVQGAVFDPATGQVSVYNPLVIDQGTQPAVAPMVPTLPQGAIVALWGGSNANNITLQDTNGSLQAGKCVNGSNGSIFGQFWNCNAAAFFAAANQAIKQGKLVPPALGTAKDGMPCPTVSDFSVVDMDPHDNVTTLYLVTANGQTAQMTAANANALANAKPLANGSDERLLSVALDGALGCTSWMAPDLADSGNMVPSLPLNELQAAAHQAAPQALVPTRDPMVLVNGNSSLTKLNLYRVGVDEPVVQRQNAASTRAYCANLRQIAPARMMLDATLTQARPSPDAAVANTLFTFLAQRFVATYENGLNCTKLLNQPDPIKVQTDQNGMAISATINGMTIGGTGGGNNGGSTPNCNVNGTALTGCTGTTMINGQTCSFAFANDTVNVTCPAAPGNQQQGAAQPQVQPQTTLTDGGKGKQSVNQNPQAQP
jgi:hypothetical protein